MLSHITMTHGNDSPIVFSPVCGIFGLKCLGSKTNVTYPTFSPDLASVPANSCGGVFVENRTYKISLKFKPTKNIGGPHHSLTLGPSVTRQCLTPSKNPIPVVRQPIHDGPLGTLEEIRIQYLYHRGHGKLSKK